MKGERGALIGVHGRIWRHKAMLLPNAWQGGRENRLQRAFWLPAKVCQVELALASTDT